MNKLNKERGAIVVEATISLSMFIFVIFTILSIVNIYYIQGKMNTAVIYAAKEMSQYSVAYYKTKDTQFVGDVKEGLEGLTGALGNRVTSGVSNALGVDQGLVGDVLNDFSPTDFIIDLATQGRDMVADYGAEKIAKTLVSQNLRASGDASTESYLKFYNVVGGLGGVDFDGTTFLGDNQEVTVVAEYEVEVIKLLNLDVKFKFKSMAKSKAWGSGV